MKELIKIQEEFENHFGIKFIDLCSRASNDYYSPAPVHNPKSTKYWLTFKSNLKGNVAIMGDFSNQGNTKVIKLNFGLDNLKTRKDNPDPEDHIKTLEKVHTNIKNLLDSLENDFGSYLSHFKKTFKSTSTVYKKGKLTIIPYKNLKTEKYAGALIIDEKGKKRWVKGSDITLVGHFLGNEDRDGFIYVCEGIKTACIIKEAISIKDSVLSIGSLYNLKPTVKYLSEKYPGKIILCGEREGLDVYKSVKAEFSCNLVEPDKYSDFYDLYEDTSLSTLSVSLKGFVKKNYIPLGVRGADEVCLYIKDRGSVVSYGRRTAGALYVDVEGVEQPPATKVTDRRYFELRAICSKLGEIDALKIIREGILPLKGSFYFFDGDSLYLIKENELKKVNLEDHVSRFHAFTKVPSEYPFNYEKLKPMELGTIENIMKMLSFFGLSSLEKKLLIGWIFNSLLCGGVKHRTPVWISGDSYAGKSHITKKFLMKLFLYKISIDGRNSTPRSVIRALDGRALPIHRDEMEPNRFKHLDALEELEYIRITATDRFPSRRIATGPNSLKEFVYCYSTLMSSIKLPKGLKKSDLARILFFDLQPKQNSNYESKLEIFENFMTPKKQAMLLKYALLRLHKVRREYNRLLKMPMFLDQKTHKKSSVLALASTYNICMEDRIDNDSLRNFIYDQSSDNKHKALLKVSSRILETLLELVVNHNAHGLPNSMPLIDLLIESRRPNEDMQYFDTTKEYLNKNGLYIAKARQEERLLIHRKRGIAFLVRILKESNRIEDYAKMDILEELGNDGPLLLKKELEVKKEGMPRRSYLMFDFKLIIEYLRGT